MRIILFFLIIPFITFAQSQKKIKQNKIKSVKVISSTTEGGKEKLINESFTRYDSNGNEIEEINYNDDGTFKSWITRKFDGDGNLLEETSYDKEGKIKKRMKAKYNAEGDVTQEEFFDKDEALVEKIIYTYNNNLKKNSETYLDGKGNEVKRVVYIYDKKGMRVEKRTYLPDGKLESLKKYEYEY